MRKLITYKQDVLACYNALVRMELREKREIMLQSGRKDGANYIMGLVQDSSGELCFFTKTRMHGDRLIEVAGIEVYCADRDIFWLPKKKLDEPITNSLPGHYTVYDKSRSRYISVLTDGTNQSRIIRPNKAELEKQIERLSRKLAKKG